jgi:protein-disulfide isomerase
MGDGPTLGAATARVAIIEYSDYECPFCKRFERQTLPSLKTRYIDSGSVLLAFRHHPLESIHRFALTAAAAATCAGRQGRFWEYHAMLFDAPPRSLDNKKIFDLAKATGLDEPTFTSCLGADVEASVRKDAASAIALGLKGTPAFLIGRIQDDGTLAVTAVLKGAQPLEAFTAAIDDALGRDWAVGSATWIILAAGSMMPLYFLRKVRRRIEGRTTESEHQPKEEEL